MILLRILLLLLILVAGSWAIATVATALFTAGVAPLVSLIGGMVYGAVIGTAMGGWVAYGDRHA